MSTKKEKKDGATKEKVEASIPEGVSVSIEGSMITSSGKLGTNKRIFNDALLKLEKAGSSISISGTSEKGLAKKAAKAEMALKKELENDMRGVSEYYERKMRLVFAHFPINVEVKGDMLYINNIIGERFPRTSRIVGSTKIEAKGQEVRIYGTSLDEVSQTCANIRLACKIRNKDSRVFQDGLYYELE